MDSIYIDRRRVRPLAQRDWKRQLNTEQAETLRTLEQVGWLLRFVRRGTDSSPRAAVFDPDHQTMAIIEPDGRLVENPGLTFRA